jgi:hypothetical protein
MVSGKITLKYMIKKNLFQLNNFFTSTILGAFFLLFFFAFPTSVFGAVEVVIYEGGAWPANNYCSSGYSAAGELAPPVGSAMYCSNSIQYVAYTNTAGDSSCPAGYSPYGFPRTSGNGSMSCCLTSGAPPTIPLGRSIIPVLYSSNPWRNNCPAGYSAAGELAPAPGTTIYCCIGVVDVPYTGVDSNGAAAGDGGDDSCPANYFVYGTPLSTGVGTMDCCYKDILAPQIDSMTVDMNPIYVDNDRTFNISITATEQANLPGPPSGFGGTYGILARSYGTTSGLSSYFGYFSWHPTRYVFSLDRMPCQNGGFASKHTNSNAAHIELVSCTTNDIGNRRTVIFEVRPLLTYSRYFNGASPYIYDLRGYATDINGNVSGWDNFNTNFQFAVRPAVPTNFSATEETCNTARLTWTTRHLGFGDPVVTDEMFVIEKSLEAADTWTNIMTISTTTTDFVNGSIVWVIVPNTPDGEAWDYRIYATSPAGNSSIVYASSLNRLCSPVVDPVVSDNCRHLNLSWTDNSINEDGHHITMVDRDGVLATLNYYVPSPGVSYESSIIPDGVRWEVAIEAYDADPRFTSVASVPVFFQTEICEPTDFSLWKSPNCTMQVGIDTWTIQPNWVDESINETEYVLEWAAVSVPAVWNEVILPISADQWTSSFLPSDAYDFRVKVRNDNFESAWVPTPTSEMPWIPNPIQRTSVTTCNADIDDIIETDYNCDCVNISWNVDGDLSTVDHFDIYRSTTGHPYTEEIDLLLASGLDRNTNTYEDCENIVSGSIVYAYRVETCFDPGCLSSISSYTEAGDGEVDEPCQDLPWWEETR